MNKKLWAAALIGPLVLAALIAWIMTPSPEKAFMTKLSKLDKMDKISWVLSVDGDTYKQYKFDGKYYAEYSSGDNSMIINIEGENLLFGTEDVAVSAAVSDSKSVKSDFWLDKLTPADIKEGSVARVKDAEGDVYTANLNDGSLVTVTFYKGVLNQVDYELVGHSKGIYNKSDKNYTPLSVFIKDFETDAEFPEYLVIKDAKKISLEDFEDYIKMSDEDLEEEDADLIDLKYAYLGASGEDIEEDYDDEFVDDSEEDVSFNEDETDFEEEDSEGGHFEFIPDEDLF